MRILTRIAAAAAVLFFLTLVAVPIVNDRTAYTIEGTLCCIPLPPGTESADSVSRAGKRTGNGSSIKESESYYFIFTWGSGIPLFPVMDIRGH